MNKDKIVETIRKHIHYDGPEISHVDVDTIATELSNQWCEWNYDENHDYYDTECGEAYCLIADDLEANKHKRCPYCGRKIKEMPLPDKP